MDPYRRPDVISPRFLDAGGHVIPYGSRWGDNGPPDDAYSRTTNLGRFAPLHTVADEVVRHLVDAYDVEVEEGDHVAEDLIHRFSPVMRAVRLTPVTHSAAPLTFVYTAFPSVIVHAGVLRDFLFPICGCDACDESCESLTDELEWHVFGVVAGAFSESFVRGYSTRAVFSLSAVDGSRSMRGEDAAADFPADRVLAAHKRLEGAPNGWRAWPVRSNS